VKVLWKADGGGEALLLGHELHHSNYSIVMSSRARGAISVRAAVNVRADRCHGEGSVQANRIPGSVLPRRYCHL
jgi:hypothetical protein